MKTIRAFEPQSRAEIDQLVAAHPFALVIATEADAIVATPLPLVLQRTDGEEAFLIGHFARTNPQLDMLRRQPRALVVFQGPHGYMSPSWLRDRTQAPTWNYATVHFDVHVEIEDQATSAHAALDRLIAHMERDRPQSWSEAEMGPRYERLATAVVAFRARILATQATFKLGQNERDDVRDDMRAALAREGQWALLDAMDRANADTTVPA